MLATSHLLGAHLVSASQLLVGTVLVFASRHLLSCLLTVTVLVFASPPVVMSVGGLLFWCLLAVTCCHVCWWVLFWCLLAVTCCHVCWWLLFWCLLAVTCCHVIGGYCSGVC